VTWTSRPDRPIRWVRAALAGWGLRSGQGIVEYGLILSLSAALAVILLVFLGGTLSAVLNAVGDAIDAAS
jgi:Flp pilus assembly pilin Flp